MTIPLEKFQNDQTSNSSLKDVLKEKQIKIKKEKFQFLASLILSNLFVFILTSSFYSDNEIKKIDIPLIDESVFLQIPLKVFIHHDLFQKLNHPVSLINEQNKVIVTNAFIHEFVDQMDDQKFYRIEIPSNQLISLQKSLNGEISAIPFHNNHNAKKGNNYEINF